MKKKIIVLAVTVILSVMALIFGIEYSDNDIKEISEGVETVVNIIEDNISTKEIPKLSEEDEQVLEYQETESEGFKEQGEVAYNGSDKAPNVKVGDYVGLTYYSQTDSRWANKMYSSIGDTSQTIASSGCGPTAAAMVVSSIKGNISPNAIADLYMQYGYRSANSGTYWSAFKWTADVFDIGYSECYNLDEAITKLKDNHYIIASCNQGLFTYGGHFIVLVGLEGDYIKVYDPYLYAGKFDVSSRINKAELRGNIVYVSIDNFKNYANAKGYFCFKNNRIDIKENTTTPVINNTVTSNVKNVNYEAKITANSGLNIRNGASTSYRIVGCYSKNTTVTILAENNKWGKTNKGWICLDYVSKLNAQVTNYIANYQKAFNATYRGNLVVDGIKGSKTNASMKKVCLKRGMRNELVRWCQDRLISHKHYYLKDGADGIFGNDTLNVVKQFQRDNGLVADGIIGIKTISILF